MNYLVFNIGNSLGVFFGGVVIVVGWGFMVLVWIGVVFVVVGLLIVLLLYCVEVCCLV